MIPKKFLITGLPRSRSAWLAMLMHHDTCWCDHELTAVDPDLKELSTRELQFDHPLRYKAVGTADTGALMVQPVAYWANYRRVLINRPKHEVFLSFIRRNPVLAADPGAIAQLEVLLDVIEARINETKKQYAFLEVDFDDLDEYEACDAIWEVIGNQGSHLSLKRFNRFKQMNIQRQDGGRPACEESTRRVMELLKQGCAVA